jgi:hypothetical protein
MDERDYQQDMSESPNCGFQFLRRHQSLIYHVVYFPCPRNIFVVEERDCQLPKI